MLKLRWKDALEDQRKRAGVTRVPAWSIKEVADDLGVSISKLALCIKWHNGPSPVMRGNKLRGNNRQPRPYYDISEIRRWWETVKDKNG